jgi:hypothetical protein
MAAQRCCVCAGSTRRLPPPTEHTALSEALASAHTPPVAAPITATLLDEDEGEMKSRASSALVLAL